MLFFGNEILLVDEKESNENDCEDADKDVIEGSDDEGISKLC